MKLLKSRSKITGQGNRFFSFWIDTYRSTYCRCMANIVHEDSIGKLKGGSSQIGLKASNINFRRMADGLKVGDGLRNNNPRHIATFVFHPVEYCVSKSNSGGFYIAQDNDIIYMVVWIKIRKSNKIHRPIMEQSGIFDSVQICFAKHLFLSNSELKARLF